MRGGGSPQVLVARLLILVISEMLRYVAFVLNVPFVVSLVALIGLTVVILQAGYGVATVELIQRLPFIGSRIPKEFSLTLDLQDIMRLYASVTFTLFLLGEIIRVIFRLKPTTLRRRLLTLFIVATLGWAFVIAHLPLMGNPPDSTLTGTVAGCVFFYLLGVAGIALGGLVTRARQFVINRVNVVPGPYGYSSIEIERGAGPRDDGSSH